MISRQGGEMWYRVGADLIVVVHLLFIGFVVGGVFLSWRWPMIIYAHIPAVLYGALIEFAGFTCPLTLLENGMRQRAGEAGYRDGFIAHYLIKVIYPPGLTHGMQIGLGVVLLLVAIVGYWGLLRRLGWRDRAAPSARDMKYGVDLTPFEARNQPTRVLGGDGGEVYAPTTSLLHHLGHDR
jgi:Protein of Unknown function (DUF2784)